MRMLKVGELFQEGKKKYQEGCKFDFGSSGGDLLIFFDKPTSKEILDITKGKCQIGLVEKNNIIFLLFKFGSQQWIDCPYNSFLSKDFELQETPEGMGYAINIYLIDSNSGILKGMRLVSMSTKFSKKFAEMISSQRYIENYDLILNNIYTNYTTNDLVKYSEIMRVGEVK